MAALAISSAASRSGPGWATASPGHPDPGGKGAHDPLPGTLGPRVSATSPRRDHSRDGPPARIRAPAGRAIDDGADYGPAGDGRQASTRCSTAGSRADLQPGRRPATLRAQNELHSARAAAPACGTRPCDVEGRLGPRPRAASVRARTSTSRARSRSRKPIALALRACRWIGFTSPRHRGIRAAQALGQRATSASRVHPRGSPAPAAAAGGHGSPRPASQVGAAALPHPLAPDVALGDEVDQLALGVRAQVAPRAP